MLSCSLLVSICGDSDLMSWLWFSRNLVVLFSSLWLNCVSLIVWLFCVNSCCVIIFFSF